MKIIKLILAWIFISFLLLLSVAIVDLVFAFFQDDAQNTASVTELYNLRDMLLGVFGESLRAVLLCYLFPRQKKAGSSYSHAITFGIVTSALIGSMWLIIGYGSFALKDPEAFVLYDGIILLLQGVLSGAGLQLLFKKHYLINPD